MSYLPALHKTVFKCADASNKPEIQKDATNPTTNWQGRVVRQELWMGMRVAKIGAVATVALAIVGFVLGGAIAAGALLIGGLILTAIVAGSTHNAEKKAWKDKCVCPINVPRGTPYVDHKNKHVYVCYNSDKSLHPTTLLQDDNCREICLMKVERNQNPSKGGKITFYVDDPKICDYEFHLTLNNKDVPFYYCKDKL